jgi:hypothetical protein
MTLHFLGGIISGAAGLFNSIGGLFSGGSSSQPPEPTPTPETDWTPLYIIGGLVLFAIFFTRK